jgi:anti-anti-sigma factor
MSGETMIPLTEAKRNIPARDVTVVHFTGPKTSLDEETLRHIHDRLLDLADEPNGSELLLDFGSVDFMSSKALDTLVSMHKKLVVRGRRMSVRNLSPVLYEVLTAMQLNLFFELHQAGQPARQDAAHSEAPLGVLVVDDNATLLHILEIGFKFEGYNVWLARDGQQAIDLYRDHCQEIDAVFLDVQLPALDGPHVLAALRSLNPSVCCCFMTGDSAPYTADELSSLAAVPILQKPFPITEAIAALGRLLGRSRRRWHERWIEIPVKK